MDFSFYSTYYPPFTNNIPITVDYSLSNENKLKYLRDHNELVMVHSGNWWSMRHPEMRTKEAIRRGVLRIQQYLMKGINKNTGTFGETGGHLIGYISCNELPVEKSIKTKSSKIKLPKNDVTIKNAVPVKKAVAVKNTVPAKNTDNANSNKTGTSQYWLRNADDMIPYIEKSLSNADWALEQELSENNRNKLGAIYCTLPVITAEQAKKYYKIAFEHGHRYFSIGVSEFLKTPKSKFEGISRIFSILQAIRSVVGEKCTIHVSGLSSFYLLPYLAYLGANSSDGSTPIQSALAYGTVFNYLGRGISASKLFDLIKNPDNNVLLFPNSNVASLEKIKKRGAAAWLIEEGIHTDKGQSPCKCGVCVGKNNKERILAFNKGINTLSAAQARVIHNIHIWRQLILSIKMEMRKDPLGWLESFKSKKLSPYLNRVHKIATESIF